MVFRLTKWLLFAVLLISILYFPTEDVKAEKFNMTYLYFGDTNRFVQTVEKTNNLMDTVAPSYFDLNDDGSLKEKVDPVFVQEMHSRNRKVVPFLSNHWDRNRGRAALFNRENLANEIVAAIKKYHLDGINVDIENLTEIDRNNYTDFIRLLREKLPEDKEISVAVAPNPYNWKNGWQGSYDYKKLAEYSDYLMLMAYDESYYGSNPGPVASYTFVEKSIQNALAQGVPNHKLVLGMPFFGRYWPVGEKGGRGVSAYRVEELIKEFHGKVFFDDIEKSPYALITIPYGVNEKVHSRTLAPGNYIFWFENDRSIYYKLQLVDQYDLLGVGSWSLTEVSDEIWSYYRSWIEGQQYFADITHHWAEADILSMKEKGWMVGTSDLTFSPNQPLTRAQGTVVLVRALGLEEQTAPGPEMNIFSDVPETYWAKNEIEIASQHGIVQGIGDGKFAPDHPLTRAEMAAMLARIYTDKDVIMISEQLDNPFVDLSTNHWAYASILFLNHHHIFMGYEDGKFYPSHVVTRAQMAALMNRIATELIE